MGELEDIQYGVAYSRQVFLRCAIVQFQIGLIRV